jgi:hypothetical protein
MSPQEGMLSRAGGRAMSVYIHLFNGCREPEGEQRLDGPVIGPFEGVQALHGREVLGIVGGEAVWEAPIAEGAVRFRGIAFTDFVVSDGTDARRLEARGTERLDWRSLSPGDARIG